MSAIGEDIIEVLAQHEQAIIEVGTDVRAS